MAARIPRFMRKPCAVTARILSDVRYACDRIGFPWTPSSAEMVAHSLVPAGSAGRTGRMAIRAFAFSLDTHKLPRYAISEVLQVPSEPYSVAPLDFLWIR